MEWIKVLHGLHVYTTDQTKFSLKLNRQGSDNIFFLLSRKRVNKLLNKILEREKN